MTIGLKSPQEFLMHVVAPDMAAFAAPNQAELRLAYHACTSLFSLRDWVFESHKNKPWTLNGTSYRPITGKAIFLEDLCKVEPAFEIVADIANATKHMVLDTTRRLTDLHGAANVHIHTISGSGLLGHGAISGGAIGSTSTTHVFVQIGSGFFDVLEAATKVHDLWKKLIAENGW